MIRFSTLVYFYRKRLRVHAMQELLAGLGIAVGVALVFSVQIANSSITGSSREILHALGGNASLQLAARGPHGFEEGTLARVKALSGVVHASGLLDQHASVSYRGHRVLVDLVGIDPSLPSLGGLATRRIGLGGLVLKPGIVLPSAVAGQLGLPDNSATVNLPSISIGVRGHEVRATVNAVLDADTVGSLSGAMVGVVSLRYAQLATGLRGRVTRVLIAAAPGRERTVRTGLARIAAGRLMIGSIDDEVHSLRQASAPISQSTDLFAAISALVGLLFTFTAMLLTVPERRRFVADLRMIGYRRRQVAQILGFQALTLGVAASLVGLIAGYALSRTATHDPPGYLAFAYPVGIQRVVDPRAVALALAGGVLVSCLAAMQSMLDLRRGRPINGVMAERGEPGHAVSVKTRRLLALSGIALVTLMGLVVIVVPRLTLLGVAATGVAMVLVAPVVFAAMLRLGDAPADHWHLNELTLAIRALRATSVRSLGLVATVAVAVFGSVGLEGAHDNLLRGLYRDYREYVGTADIWIAHADDDLALQSFPDAGRTRRLKAIPGVRSVRSYGGGLLDLGDRRVWVIARSAADRTMVPADQVIDGDVALANARVRGGGWIAISQQIADAHHINPGGMLRVPTPTGDISYRVAATTTNLGWGPGAIVMNWQDYRRGWASSDPSALEVDLDPATPPARVQRAIRAVLGEGTALQVQTARARAMRADGVARAGLARLGQISTLLLIAAALAMAAAMGAGTWQRRSVLAQLRIMGWRSRKLWGALLLETALVVGTGCAIGAASGTYGHYLGDRWLQLSTGYPTPFSLLVWPTLVVCTLVGCAALAVAAIPGYLVSRTPPRVGLGSTT